ncbi:MAG TPA: DUF4199 domain-containing protein [Chryseolinea sp.]|nr:DUF4199 domain-containing protein [Chryseolinea sp.]HPM30291.1 DUF4199 domain-containing protein [Chryseolinea sp.]
MKLPVLFKTSARYGAVSGTLAFILLIVSYYLGRHPMLVSPLLDFRILLFGIFTFFALREFRDYNQEGFLSFAQGMLGSLMVVFVSSVITSALLIAFGKWEDGFVAMFIRESIEYYKTFPKEDIERIGKETFQRNLDALPATNISRLAGIHFFQGSVIGFFISIIVSVILRQQPKT